MDEAGALTGLTGFCIKLSWTKPYYGHLIFCRPFWLPFPACKVAGIPSSRPLDICKNAHLTEEKTHLSFYVLNPLVFTLISKNALSYPLRVRMFLYQLLTAHYHSSFPAERASGEISACNHLKHLINRKPLINRCFWSCI